METNYRRCISCRRAAHRSEFWRIVRDHACGRVQFDQGMGRSAYLCPQASCLQAAQKKNRLGRALKVQVPGAIYQTLWQQLEQASSTQTQASQEQHVDQRSVDQKTYPGASSQRVLPS